MSILLQSVTLSSTNDSPVQGERRETRQIQAQNLKGQCHEKRDQTDSSTEFKGTVSREERPDRFKHRTYRDGVTRREARPIQAQNLKGQCHKKRDQTYFPAQNLKGQCHEKIEQTDFPAQNLKGQCHEKRDQTYFPAQNLKGQCQEKRPGRFPHKI